MKRIPMTERYSMFPVIVRNLRRDKACASQVRSFITRARSELSTQETELLARRERVRENVRSRMDVLAVMPCFECEHRVILYAQESLNSLEAYLDGGSHILLAEALADFGASDTQYEYVIKLRKKLPALLQEQLQRAA